MKRTHSEELLEHPGAALAACARKCPSAIGVYRLYQGERLLHVGMAAGGATLRSELLRHAQGECGPLTQCADRVEWEVAPDAIFAYRRFLKLYDAATYRARGSGSDDGEAPSASRRHSAALANEDA